MTLAVFDALTQALDWNRSAILHGQLWRLLTPAFVHLTWGHAAANLIGFLLWWRLEGLANLPLTMGRRIGAALGGAVVVHSLLLVLTPYDWYAGASATLYGLFVFTALRCGWRGGVMLALLLGWLIEGARFVDYSFAVAHQAHWVGVGVGLLSAIVFWAYQRRLPAWGLPAKTV